MEEDHEEEQAQTHIAYEISFFISKSQGNAPKLHQQSRPPLRTSVLCLGVGLSLFFPLQKSQQICPLKGNIVL